MSQSSNEQNELHMPTSTDSHRDQSGPQTEVEEANDVKHESNMSTPPRKRTRASAEQLVVLEDTFAVNVSPNSKLRKQLAERLQMSERSIQIWFQNRRAKVKHMQKRAQMQMQQASIRAQLYHYHQQHYGYNGTPLMPLQAQHSYYPSYTFGQRMPLPRAQSVDVLAMQQQPQQQQQHPQAVPGNHVMHPFPTPLGSSSVPPFARHPTPAPHTSQQLYYTPPPSILSVGFPPNNEQSAPTGLSPSSLHSEPHKPTLTHTSPPSSSQSSTISSALPVLVDVPDAGPTAMLAVPELGYAPSTPAATPPISASTDAGADLWHSQDSQQLFTAPKPVMFSPERDQPLATIDPSSLMMTPPVSIGDHGGDSKDIHLNITTLTIGTWHRLKLCATDLMCVYQSEQRLFAWHITDNDCHFKMEIPLDAVASIEYIAADCDVVADLHFDISESPLFYMESKAPEKDAKEHQRGQTNWIQCSDFTEGKQASRFFRHTLKGVASHMKQELLHLTNVHPEIGRLVRFVEPTVTLQPEGSALWMQQQQQDAAIAAATAATYINPMYW